MSRTGDALDAGQKAPGAPAGGRKLRRSPGMGSAPWEPGQRSPGAVAWAAAARDIGRGERGSNGRLWAGSCGNTEEARRGGRSPAEPPGKLACTHTRVRRLPPSAAGEAAREAHLQAEGQEPRSAVKIDEAEKPRSRRRNGKVPNVWTNREEDSNYAMPKVYRVNTGHSDKEPHARTGLTRTGHVQEGVTDGSKGGCGALRL